MRKTFFMKTIDLDKLNEQLEYYLLVYSDLYIFMNKETAREIFKQLEHPFKDKLQKLQKRSPMGEYLGCKIFEDDTLRFGVIEVR